MKSDKKNNFSLKKFNKKFFHFFSFLWLNSCAGWICIRKRSGKKELLCIMKKNGQLALPKWRKEKWETLEWTALREFREETWLHNNRLGIKIGTIYDYKRRKKITLYWIEQSTGQHSIIRDEAIMWVELSQSAEKMQHKSERQFIKKYLL